MFEFRDNKVKIANGKGLAHEVKRDMGESKGSNFSKSFLARKKPCLERVAIAGTYRSVAFVLIKMAVRSFHFDVNAIRNMTL